MENSRCKECGIETKGTEYCKRCAPYMNKCERRIKGRKRTRRSKVWTEDTKPTNKQREKSMEKTVWESQYEHHVMDVQECQFVTKDKVQQVIKPVYENQYSKEYIDWFVPKGDLTPIEREYHVELMFYEDFYTNGGPINDKPSFICKEQRDINLSHYLKRVVSVSTLKELRELSKMIFSAQDREGGVFFFPKGGSKKFWDMYREIKEDLLETETEPMYDKVKDIVDEIVSKGEPKYKEVMARELEKLDRQDLWNAIMFAKRSGRRFSYATYRVILTVANKAA